MNKIVILGAGESGAGAAVLAKKEGFEVFVSDMSKINDKYKKILDDHQIAWEEGQHTEEKILAADEIIKSPGIPDTAPMIKKIKERGIGIVSEIEFAGRYTDSKMICITGSNGKTTTTSLIYHIFKNAGYDVGLAGNIGNSLALQVAEDPHAYYVIELSSFPARQYVRLPCQHRHLAEYHSRPSGSLRLQDAELCGCQDANHSESDATGCLHLLE